MSVIDCYPLLEKIISFGGIFRRKRLLNLPCLTDSAALHFLGCNLVMSNHYNQAWLLFLPELPTHPSQSVLGALPRGVTLFWSLPNTPTHSSPVQATYSCTNQANSKLSHSLLYPSSRILGHAMPETGAPQKSAKSCLPTLHWLSSRVNGKVGRFGAPWFAISRGSLTMSLSPQPTNVTVTLHDHPFYRSGTWYRAFINGYP